MKKTLLLLTVISLALLACGESINTVDEALQEIKSLDEQYNTDYHAEKINVVKLTRSNIKSYMEDLEKKEAMVKPEGEKQARWIDWLFSAREQMLESQYSFQEAWLGYGEEGRVSDGFKCSDIDAIRQSTLLMEDALVTGDNATRIFDSLLTESKAMQEKIGIGDAKPDFYGSNFGQIYTEIRSNVVAMHEFCNETVETKKLNFTERIEKLDINTTKYRGG